MSTDIFFTKNSLDQCLKALAKEFRKLNGKAMHEEIILISGASVLANYGFRDMTYDVDAVIQASSAMKDAINHVGDALRLPNGWLNSDFTDLPRLKIVGVFIWSIPVMKKTIAKAVAAAVKGTIAATKGVVVAIFAGGGAAIVVIVVTFLAACFLCYEYGLFNSTDGITVCNT